VPSRRAGTPEHHNNKETFVNKSILWLLAGLSTFGPAHALDVTNAMLANDAKDAKSVLSFGMGTEGQRYSTLTRRREAARPGIAAADPQRQDVRHRLVLAHLCRRHENRHQAVEV
jgi:hypothetical protein